MIIPNSNIQITNSEAFTRSVAKITSSPHIMKVLRDGIYSDKIQSVIRETISNALDSHTAADKKDVAVEVYLPNILEPTFRVIDYGLGLNDYEVREIFFSYGAPDGVGYKAQSNEYIGMMGLGSKSPWCYSPVFQVVATKDNVRRTYNAYINEQEIGDVAQLSEEFVDAPNGVEVQIPVKSSDFHLFASKLAAFLRFNTRPIKVHGNWPEYKDEWLIKGSKWGVIKGDNNSFLVMGGVPYEINTSKIDENLLSYSEREILHSGLVIFADIGEVTVAASRESVSYTEKTGKFVSSICKIVLEEARTSMTDAFSKADTEYKARELYYQYFSSHGRMGKIFNALIDSGFKPIAANGKEVVSYHFDNQGREVDLKSQRRYSYKKIARFSSQYRFVPYGIKTLYVNIGAFYESKVKRKMTQDLVARNLTNSFIMCFADQAEYQKFIDDNGFTCEIVNVESIILPKVVRTYSGSGKNTDNARTWDGGRWVSQDVDLDQGGYYVLRKHNDFYLSNLSQGDYTHAICQGIEMLKSEFEIEHDVFAFTPSVAAKLDKNIWFSYGDLLKEKLEEHYEDNKPKIGWGQLNYSHSALPKMAAKMKSHPAFEMFKNIENYPNYNYYNSVRCVVGLVAPEFDLKEINILKKAADAIFKAYPLINGDNIQASMEYIEAMDSYRASLAAKKENSQEKV
jgi:hypothetical protein